MLSFVLLFGLSIACLGQDVQRTHMISNFAEITPTADGLFVTPIQSPFEKTILASQAVKVYGEWRRYEALLLCAFVKEGDVIVEVGGQFGVHTVPLSKCVGSTGRVVTVEWNPKNFNFLSANLGSNDITNVVAKNIFLGNESVTLPYDKVAADVIAAVKASGYINLNSEDSIDFETLDDVMNFVEDDTYSLEEEEQASVAKVCPKVLKVNVETMVGRDFNILQGARNMISQCRPIIYTNLDCVEDSHRLISFLQEELDYDVNWHLPAFVRDENDFKAPLELAYAIPSVNILAYPAETPENRRVSDGITVPITDNEYLLSKYGVNFSVKDQVYHLIQKDCKV